MTSQDILFIVLSVCLIFVTVPLTMILWRTHKMLDRVEKLLAYADHLRGIALRFEEMPMRFFEAALDRFMNKK